MITFINRIPKTQKETPFSKGLKIGITLTFIAGLTITAKAIFVNDSCKLHFDITLRERFELWDGMNAKNYGNPDGVGSLHDKILFQRVVAGFTFKPSGKIDIAAHIQDSRAFGWSLRNSEYPELFRVKKKNTIEPYYTMNPNEEFFEIYDLYIRMNGIFKNISLKVGRQKIAFGNNRLFGPGEWGNTGRWTWDAVRASYKKGNNTIDAFGGGTKIHDPSMVSIPFTQTEHWGGGVYAHVNFPRSFAIEPFYAIKTQGSTYYIRTLNFTRHWVGARTISKETNPLAFDFTLSYEFGHDNGKSIHAYGVIGLLGYRFLYIPAKPTFGIRETYASGGTNSDAQVHTFDPAFGAKDSYYERMNITSWSNLDDRELILFLSPFKEVKLELNYHRFYVPEPTDAIWLSTLKLQPGKHHLGDKFNIYASYSPGKHLQMVGVFGYFWAGDVEPINGIPAKSSSWLAIQVLYRFEGLLIGKCRNIN